MPQAALRVVTLGLFVGQRRQTMGTPVDDVLAPVDEALFVKVNEHLSHRAVEVVIQREPSAVPSRTMRRSL